MTLRTSHPSQEGAARILPCFKDEAGLQYIISLEQAVTATVLKGGV